MPTYWRHNEIRKVHRGPRRVLATNLEPDYALLNVAGSLIAANRVSSAKRLPGFRQLPVQRNVATFRANESRIFGFTQHHTKVINKRLHTMEIGILSIGAMRVSVTILVNNCRHDLDIQRVNQGIEVMKELSPEPWVAKCREDPGILPDVDGVEHNVFGPEEMTVERLKRGINNLAHVTSISDDAAQNKDWVAVID